MVLQTANYREEYSCHSSPPPAVAGVPAFCDKFQQAVAALIVLGQAIAAKGIALALSRRPSQIATALLRHPHVFVTATLRTCTSLGRIATALSQRTLAKSVCCDLLPLLSHIAGGQIPFSRRDSSHSSAYFRVALPGKLLPPK
jgi:hypothetical protein